MLPNDNNNEIENAIVFQIYSSQAQKRGLPSGDLTLSTIKIMSKHSNPCIDLL